MLGRFSYLDVWRGAVSGAGIDAAVIVREGAQPAERIS